MIKSITVQTQNIADILQTYTYRYKWWCPQLL